MMFNLLSTIIFLPVIGAIIVLLAGKQQKTVKWLSAIFTFIPMVLSFVLFGLFDRTATGIQFEEKVDWIPAIKASYHLGVDGLSLPLVVLTAFLGFMVVLISWKEHERVREYFAWLLLLETSILGVFASLDLLLFFIFWEIEIVPMYFLISVWGAGRKDYSAMKYVIYTLFGSAFMLAGILSLYFSTGTMDVVQLAQSGLGMVQAVMPAAVIFFLLFTGFAIKLPVFPVHTWLPDAHTDAPTAGSVMLAGSLIKMGGYGIIRVCVTLFPGVAKEFAIPLIILAVISVVYGAAVTLRQTDIKRMIAYSSVSHMGYVLLGVFALGQVSLTGAALQMFSHGILTGLLFTVAGLTMHNVHERDLRKMGGLSKQVPIIGVVFSIAGLGSLGLPLTSGFAAEFLTFVGSYADPMGLGIRAFTIVTVVGVVLAAGYILWMIQRSFYGPEQHKFDGAKDADTREQVYMFCFVALTFLVGIYPSILTDIIKVGVAPIIGSLGG